MSGIVENLKTLVVGQSRTIRNIITILFTLALEALINDQIFMCPETNYKSYGWMFIFAPAAIMAVISVMLSDDFVAMTKGMCYYKTAVNRRRLFPCYKPRRGCFGFFCCPSSKFSTVLYNVVAAAALWLFWAFIQGR